MSSPSISRLFVQWEEARAQGRDLSPEELAAGRDELIAPLRDGIAALRRMRHLMSGVNGSADAPTLSQIAPPTVDPLATITTAAALAARLSDAPAGYEL